MKKNESTIDRVIRAILGIIILYYAYVSLAGAWAIVGYVVGIILLFTAATGFCYLYKVIGINTKNKDEYCLNVHNLFKRRFFYNI